MADLIDRQQEIDAVDDYIGTFDAIDVNFLDGLKTAKKLMMQLPSAQPERKVFEEMSDAEFEKWLYEHGICNPDIHDLIQCSVVPLLIDNAINELPAQPERKSGKWIPVTNGRGGFECDRCHCYAPSYQDGVEWLSAFCPNCGCRMGGDESEDT